MRWFLLKGTATLGPFTESQMMELARTDVLLKSDRVRTEGESSWQPAGLALDWPADGVLTERARDLERPALTEIEYGAKRLAKVLGTQPVEPRVAHLVPSLDVAPFGVRALAFLLDLAFQSGSVFVASFIVDDLWFISTFGIDALEFAVALTLIGFNGLYHIGFQVSPLHATPGKWICGIRVTDGGGRPAHLFSAAGRWVGSFPSMICLGAGYLAAIRHSSRRTWHDRIAGTLVIRA
jgi:uncharacterized RDD family membrane protein YckC